MVAIATSLKPPQLHFTAIIHAQKATNRENFANIGHVLSKIIGLEPIVKIGSSFGSYDHPRSLKMVPFDRPDTTSYPTSKATICLSYAVSEI